MDDGRLTTRDCFLGQTVPLIQPAKGHRAGTDAVFLSAAVPKEGSLIDVGASTGAVGLMASRGQNRRNIFFIEQDSYLASLCQKNILLNNQDKAIVANCSLFDKKALLEYQILPVKADHVVTNPPFFDASQVTISPDRKRSEAHVFSNVTLNDWLTACARLVRPKGSLTLIHRAERITDILNFFETGFGAVRIRFIYPKQGRSAHRVIVRAIKNSRALPQIDCPLILHQDNGFYTEEAEAINKGKKESLFL